MATKAPKLSTSDLADILAALTEVTKPYQLGIQLRIDLEKLDEVEKNHHEDVDRQKTEVIKYWLRNSPDASWTTLANAVERMGGHARLVVRLRCQEESSRVIDEHDGDSLRLFSRKISSSHKIKPRFHLNKIVPVSMCTPCNVLLCGNIGHGKSTMGNRILNSDRCFRINNQRCQTQTSHSSAFVWSVSQGKNYVVNVCDHDGLFEGECTIDTLSTSVPLPLNLVIFVLKYGRSFDDSDQDVLRALTSKWKISRISALVLTHCERLSEEERGEMIEQFKRDHPSVAKLMGKGILAVGFPDNSHVKVGTPLSESVEEDRMKLWQLIYLSDETVNIPLMNLQTRSECRSSLQLLSKDTYLISSNLETENVHQSSQCLQGSEASQQHQTENRWCEIL